MAVVFCAQAIRPYTGGMRSLCIMRSALLPPARLLLCAISLLCCSLVTQAQPAVTPTLNAMSESLLHSELARLTPSTDSRRLYFLGVAAHDASPAFMGDTALAAQRMRELAAAPVILQLANPPADKALVAPLATAENLQRTLARIGEVVRPQDLVVVLVSTHGTDRLLAVQAEGKELPPLSARNLARLLRPLRDTPTVLILSACYSGSLIPALRADKRIILTAAAADRASFGCGTDDNNTFFVDELLRYGFTLEESLSQSFARARQQVAEREKRMELAPPSEPQIYVGRDMRDFVTQPLRSWLPASTQPPLTR